MHRVIFELDTGSIISSKNESPECILETKNFPQIDKLLQLQKPRKIQTFMLSGVQYFKADDIYWLIKNDESIETIGRGKYYKKRKVSNYEV